MAKRVAIIISPNYKDYAKKYLAECYKSLKSQDYPGKMKIFITDNETSGESFELIQELAPEVEIWRNHNNDGFAKGNNDAFRLAMKEEHDYYILFNMDAEMEPNCVSELIRVAETDNKIGAVQARLMLHQNKEKINSLGNTTHFLGFGYSIGYKEQFKIPTNSAGRQNSTFEIKPIHYPSGAGALFTHECLTKVGLYDEEYWMYNEDQEHGWRIWLKGYKCVLAPEAVVYHKYEFGKSIKQYYWMDRNRIISTLICYRLPTLILITPACLLMEIGHILFSIKNGWWREKRRVWMYFFKPRTWAYIFKARRRNQKGRKVKDAQIAKLITGRIWYQEIDDWKLRVINPFFNLYWKICKFIIIW